MKKINIFKYAKLQSIVMGYIGLALGIIYSFGGLVIDLLVSLNLIATMETPGLSLGTFLAFGALIGMPVIFIIGGFIIGIIGGLLYNLFSKILIKVNLKIWK